MAEMGALIVVAMLLAAAYGGGYALGIVIRRIWGVDDPNREQKRKAKEQRREDKRAARMLPRGWPGRFPPRVPQGQPPWTQEPQQPPNQNFFMYFGPRGGSANSEDSEDDDPRTGRGPRTGSYGPGGMFL